MEGKVSYCVASFIDINSSGWETVSSEAMAITLYTLAFRRADEDPQGNYERNQNHQVTPQQSNGLWMFLSSYSSCYFKHFSVWASMIKRRGQNSTVILICTVDQWYCRDDDSDVEYGFCNNTLCVKNKQSIEFLVPPSANIIIYIVKHYSGSWDICQWTLLIDWDKTYQIIYQWGFLKYHWLPSQKNTLYFEIYFVSLIRNTVIHEQS